MKSDLYFDSPGGGSHAPRHSNRSDVSSDLYSDLSGKRNDVNEDARGSSMRWSYVPYEPIPNVKVTWLSTVAHLLQIVQCVIIGVVVGLSMYAFRALTSQVWESWYALVTVDEASGKPLLLFAGILLTSAFAFAVRMRVPECSGDGMSSLKISMALANCPSFCSLVVRFFVSAIYIGFGNPMGIAAPGMHLGTMISANIYYCGWRVNAAVVKFLRDHRMKRTKAKTRISRLSFPPVNPTKVREQDLERGMPTAQLLGLVAAWSALFYSPISAVLYAIEEYIDVRVLTIPFAHMVVAATSAAFVSFESSTPSYIKANEQFLTSTSDGATFADHLLWVVVATIMGFSFGFLGFLFSSTVLYVRERTFLWIFWREEFTPILSGVVTCSALYSAYIITGDKGVWSIGMESFDATGLQRHDVPLLFYFVFPCGKLLAVAIGLACDSPGGLILPVLLSGGILGYGIGQIVESIFPSVSLMYELCGCLGASSLMASLTRTPLAATALTYSMARGGSQALMIPLLLAPILACVTASWLQMERLSDLILQQDGIDPFNIALTIDRGVRSQSTRVNALGRGHDPSSDSSSIKSGSVFRRESEIDPSSTMSSHKQNRSYSRDTHDDGQGSQFCWFSPSTHTEPHEAQGMETISPPSQSLHSLHSRGSRTLVSAEMKKLARLISGDTDGDTGRTSGPRDSRSSRKQSEPSTHYPSKRSTASPTTSSRNDDRRESRESSNVESPRSVTTAFARTHRLGSPPSPRHPSGELGRHSVGDRSLADVFQALGPAPQEDLEEDEEESYVEKQKNTEDEYAFGKYAFGSARKPQRGDRRCFSEQPQCRGQAVTHEILSESPSRAGTVVPFRRHSTDALDGLMELQKNMEFEGRLIELHNSRKAPAMETFRRGIEQKNDDKLQPYASLLMKRMVGRGGSENKGVDHPSAAEPESLIDIRPSSSGSGNAWTTPSANVCVRLWRSIISTIRST